MKISTFVAQSAFLLTTLSVPAVGQITIQAEKLVDFVGCDATTMKPDAIRAAWDSAMDLAYVSSGGIKWDWHSAVDFLAGPDRNSAYQTAIKAVLNAAYTYRRTWWWWEEFSHWDVQIRCDDIDGTCKKYSGTAAAYTINPGKRPGHNFKADIDTIVICPTVFSTKPTCKDALNDHITGKNRAADLAYFQCQGYIILHELFHLDSLSDRGGAGHIKDLKFNYKPKGKDKFDYYPAYGPMRTKVLALHPSADVGQYVVTNADNLAQYSLSSWAVAKLNTYLSLPVADGIPNEIVTPKWFNATDYDALVGSLTQTEYDETVGAWVEDNTDDPGYDSSDVGVFTLTDPDTEEYVDCNNNGNIEWFTRPFVSQDFAQSSIADFCASISGSENTAEYTVDNTDIVLYLAAVLDPVDTSCTSLSISTDLCTQMLGELITSCDTDSTSRKYGGIYHTECTSWAVIVNGTSGPVADPDSDFSCQIFVPSGGDDVQCACTDGYIYPTDDTAQACNYTSSPGGGTVSSNESGEGGSTTSTGGTTGQQLAWASYIAPSGDSSAWDRIIGYASGELSVLIANVVNGPDTTVDSSWQKVIEEAAASNKTVIGYVRTGYLGLSDQAFSTRLGSTALADWVDQIETDIDLWYSLYPDSIGGIFFDEAWNECGIDNIYSNLYQLLNDYTKREYPGALTVLNPGATMPQCFENSADTLLTFESNYDNYINSYTANDWSSDNTAKIWHIIYNVAEADVAAVAALALERGAGMLQVTDDNLPNPYDTLPDESYMKSLIGAISGGSPVISEPTAYSGGSAASTPSGLTVTGYEYTSVSLEWSVSTNAIAYKIYVNGEFKVYLPSYMTAVTVGNLAVGTSGFEFQVSAVSGDGTETAKSSTVTASTDSPASVGKYIQNVTSSIGADTTSVSADVIVPYAYVRVYILHKQDDDWSTENGWPIYYYRDDDEYVWLPALYMVESGILYKYSGSDYSWSWTDIGTATASVDKYTYSWEIPLGTSDISGDGIVIQTEGYAPLLTYMHPCPDHIYDGYCG